MLLLLFQATEALVNSAAGYKLLPKYHQLNEAKKTLIPAFEVSEDGKDVIVPLQDLLNMDVAQILEDPEVKAAILNLLEQVPGGKIEIRDHFKIGLDGLCGLDLFNHVPFRPFHLLSSLSCTCLQDCLAKMTFVDIWFGCSFGQTVLDIPNLTARTS